jgi:hypothetical protein
VSGPRTVTRDRAGQDSVVFTDLPPGRYEVEPVYAGGPVGARRSVRVDAGQSAAILLAKENVGGVSLFATPEVCRDATHFGIVQEDGRVPVARFVRTTGCDRMIEGLPPGIYKAYYQTDNIPVGSRFFTVEPQRLVRVAVSGVFVTVAGRVLYNGAPAAGSILILSRSETPSYSKVPLEIVLDAQGQFSATVPEGGEFRLSLLRDRAPVPVDVRSVKLLEPSNFFEWSINGSVLNVTLPGWNREEGIGVMRLSKSSMSGLTFKPSDEIRLEVGYGDYTVSASVERGGGSRQAWVPACVTLSQPEVQLTLRPGRTVEVEFSQATHFPAGFIVLSSSAKECIVPLATFSFDRLPLAAFGIDRRPDVIDRRPDVARKSSRFVFYNFPPDDRIVWSVDGKERREFLVSKDGLLVIR